MASSSFGRSLRPYSPNFAKTPRGLVLEDASLRQDIDRAFSAIESSISGSSPGGTSEKMSFSFNTGPNLVLGALNKGDTIVHAVLAILTPFNGANPTIHIGTSTRPWLLFGPRETDIKLPHRYDNSHVLQIPANDQLVFSLRSDGSTQGAGILLYEVWR